MMGSRVQNVRYEHGRMLLPVEGYQNEPVMPLEVAIEPLFSIFDSINLLKYVWVSKERCKEPADGLSQDESASIMLYTFEWNTKEHSLYFILNQTLRLEDRQKLKPWYPYLKLFITALSRLPPINDIVYRGVKFDLTDQYKSDTITIWWGVSSCTDNINTLESEQFCGTTGTRTILTIKCLSGRSIKNHSYYQKENEIILMPGRYLQKYGQYSPSNDIHMIQLHEIKPPYELFPLPIPDPWHQVEPGICVEGICTNKECIAHQKEVIIPIGFRKFDVLIDTNASTIKCPMCLKYVEISKIGLSHCQWRWYGIKQTLPGGKPLEYSEDWSLKHNYSIFQYDIQGPITWLQLIIEAKPK